MKHWVSRLYPYRYGVALALMFGVFTIAANLGLMSTAAYLIAKAAQHPSTILLLWVPIVGVRFFGTSRGVFRYGDRYFSHDVTFRLLKDLRQSLYRMIEPLSPAALKRHLSGDLWTRFGADVETLQNAYLGLVTPVVVAAGGLLIAAGLEWLISFGLALLLLAMLVLVGVGLPWAMDRITRGYAEETVAIRATRSVRWVDAIFGLSDLITLGAFPQYQTAQEVLESRWRVISRRLNHLKGIAAGLNELGSHAIPWVILVVGSGLVISGKVQGFLLPVAVLLALASFEAIRPLAMAFQMRGTLTAADRRIMDLADSESWATAPKPLILYQPQPKSLEWSHVWYRYGLCEPWILEDVSMTLDPGAHVAVMGESGAGKSTLISLVLRFLDPISGSLLYGQEDLLNFDGESVRKNISAVPQDPHIFDTTLRQNLLLANPQASETVLWNILEMVELKDWATFLPEGLEVFVGEHGQGMSGGHRKKLALARALLKETGVVLLDEPTEGLDALSARRIMTRIMTSLKGKTVLWITHDPAHLTLVDRVFTLHDGQLTDQLVANAAEDII